MNRTAVQRFDAEISGKTVLGFSFGLDVEAMGRAAEHGDLPACLGPTEGFIIGYTAEGPVQVPHTYPGILHEDRHYGWTLRHFAYGGRALITAEDRDEVEAWLDRTQTAGWRDRRDCYGNHLVDFTAAADDMLLRGDRLGMVLAECEASAEHDS